MDKDGTVSYSSGTCCWGVLSHVGHVWLFVTPWTVARQAPLSLGFSRQEYWSGLPCPPPGILPTQGSNPDLWHCEEILYHLSHQMHPNLLYPNTLRDWCEANKHFSGAVLTLLEKKLSFCSNLIWSLDPKMSNARREPNLTVIGPNDYLFFLFKLAQLDFLLCNRRCPD